MKTMMKLDTNREPRDPVDVAEQQRDYDETYGTPEQRLEDWLEYEERQADLYRGEKDEHYR